MKSRVFVIALLCLLFIFQGVSADPWLLPTPTYNGDLQYIINADGYLGNPNQWFCRLKGTTAWVNYCKDVQAKDAGEYVFEYFFGTSENPPAELKEIRAYINPAPVTLTWAEDSKRTLEYNGRDQIPANAVTVSGIVENDKCEPVYIYNGKEAHKDAKDYPGKLIVTGLKSTKDCNAENYALPADRTGDFKITAKKVNLKWNAETKYPYTGKEQGPAAGNVEIVGLVNGEKQEDVARITLTMTPNPSINVGDYTAAANVTFDPQNYVLAEGAKKSFNYSITKAKIIVDPVPVIADGPLTYTGKEQPLLKIPGTARAGADQVGKIVYVINNDPKSSTAPGTIPGAADPGEYKVTYYVTDFDTNNYECGLTEENPGTVEGSVTIEKARIGVTFTLDGEDTGKEKSITYDGKDHTIGLKGFIGTTDLTDKLELTITDKTKGTACQNPLKDAGTYTASAAVIEEYKDFYVLSDEDASFTLTIKKAPVTVAFTIDGKEVSGERTIVFDEGEHPIDFTAKTEFENNVRERLVGTLTRDGEPEANAPRDAAEYMLSVTLREDAVNYSLDPAPSQKLTISPAKVNVFWKVNDNPVPGNRRLIIYDEQEHPITFTAIAGDNIYKDTGTVINDKLNLTIKKDGEDFLDAIIETGVYHAELSLREGFEKNYWLNYANSIFALTITEQYVNTIEMFRIGNPEEVCLRCGVSGGELPATGLPTRVNMPLAVRPEGLNYTDLNMRIQIPTLDVDVELAGVPTMDGVWKVEWLSDRAGLLSGTALPGDGYSIVAAHNTLNAEEYGPFALLSTLENNDMIFVNAPDGSLGRFRVYANELMAPNDMEKLASVAEQKMNTLVLVTCENESVDGSYLNRRVVFAEPLN